ncbi:MAG: transposase [Selenomonadaceae bacterium]|nr:transposase [Selenomonadaceae bacterium]
MVDSGCKWRQLPHYFSDRQTVYSFFCRAKESGLWDKILEHLVKINRQKAGRNPNSSYTLIDSQSVKTAYASECIDYDKEKKATQNDG